MINGYEYKFNKSDHDNCENCDIRRDPYVNCTDVDCEDGYYVRDDTKRVLEIPEGCEVDSITTEENSVVVTFKQKEPQLPKTWEEFCENYPTKVGECYITTTSDILQASSIYGNIRVALRDRDLLPDHSTAEAVLALCQLIQLRECYNQGWQPNWSDLKEAKYIIMFVDNKIDKDIAASCVYSPLYFKTKELRDQFLENFRDLIEKLKPLYGIMEGGEE